MFLNTITNSFNTAIGRLLGFLPEIVAAIILILIGAIVASFIKSITQRLLTRLGFNKLADKIGFEGMIQASGIKMDPAGIISILIYWFILLIFIVAAANSLHLSVLTDLLNRIYVYIPQVIAAIVILFVGLAAANIIGDVIRGLGSLAKFGYQDIIADTIKWVIIIFIVLATLEQLNIAQNLINILFTGFVITLTIGIGLAIGLAFGLGGKDIASQALISIIRQGQSSAVQKKTDQRPDKRG